MRLRNDAGGLIVALSRRNLRTLLVKLDDPMSARTVITDDVDPPHTGLIMRALKDDQADRPAAPVIAVHAGTTVVVAAFNARALRDLLEQQVTCGTIELAVETGGTGAPCTLRIERDDDHYRGRVPPGPMTEDTEEALVRFEDT